MMKFEFELTADDIDQHAEGLIGFHEEFSEFYRTSTRNAAPQALEYLKGQLLCESRRNMSQMSVRVTNVNVEDRGNTAISKPRSAATPASGPATGPNFKKSQMDPCLKL